MPGGWPVEVDEQAFVFTLHTSLFCFCVYLFVCPPKGQRTCWSWWSWRSFQTLIILWLCVINTDKEYFSWTSEFFSSSTFSVILQNLTQNTPWCYLIFQNILTSISEFKSSSSKSGKAFHSFYETSQPKSHQKEVLHSWRIGKKDSCVQVMESNISLCLEINWERGITSLNSRMIMQEESGYEWVLQFWISSRRCTNLAMNSGI